MLHHLAARYKNSELNMWKEYHRGSHDDDDDDDGDDDDDILSQQLHLHYLYQQESMIYLTKSHTMSYMDISPSDGKSDTAVVNPPLYQNFAIS